MKQITLSHTTALAALRDLRTGSRDTINLINDTLLNHTNPKSKIEILIDDNKSIYTNIIFKQHRSLHFNNAKNRIQILNNIFVTSPELTIIHMASKLNYFELALLIHEFCGTFSIQNNQEGFISDLPTLTTVMKLQKFVSACTDKISQINGLRNLKSILEFASDNSASPMESRLFIKLCGKRFLGMYGCKNLKQNRKIFISKEASQIAGQNYIIPDISCLSKKVAIEYDSSQFHETSEQGQKDKRRRDALVNDGWKVFTIVPAQMQNPEIFDIIARKILRSINQDARIRCKNFIQKRNEVFEFLR